MADYLRAGWDHLAIECIDAFEEFGLNGGANFFRNTLGQVDPKRNAGGNGQRDALLWLIFGGLRLGPHNKDKENCSKVLHVHGAFRRRQ